MGADSGPPCQRLLSTSAHEVPDGPGPPVHCMAPLDSHCCFEHCYECLNEMAWRLNCRLSSVLRSMLCGISIILGGITAMLWGITVICAPPGAP